MKNPIKNKIIAPIVFKTCITLPMFSKRVAYFKVRLVADSPSKICSPSVGILLIGFQGAGCSINSSPEEFGSDSIIFSLSELLLCSQVRTLEQVLQVPSKLASGITHLQNFAIL